MEQQKAAAGLSSERCGSIKRMNDETREMIVALLTRIGMMAEDLSVIALGGEGQSGEELAALIGEIQRRVFGMAMLSEQAESIVN